MKKIIVKKKEHKKRISPKIMFYSFLMLSILVILAGSYSVNNKTKTIAENPNSKEAPASQPHIYTETISDISKEQEEMLIEQIEETLEDTTDDKTMSLPSPKGDEKQVTTYIRLPVTGDIIKPFSDSELIYSETMADYRTHPGLDIKSDIGDDVFCPQNGKIAEISKDDELGYSVKIDHGNMISKISNLSSKIDLKVGDKVNIGQKIGICGDSADYESADKPHIHYELTVNGVNVNPLQYLE